MELKLIHTADWHLGKVLNGHSFLEDQQYVLKQLIEVLEREQPDALIIAGDIYDTAYPSKYVIQLMEETIAKINLEIQIPVVMINGNHDGKERLRYGASWFRHNQLYITTEIEQFFEPVILGNVAIYTLPFFTLSEAREYLEVSVENYEEAVKKLVDQVRPQLNPAMTNILVGHFTLTGAPKSDSERDITIGTIEAVSPQFLVDFDAVMLGHIHHPVPKAIKQVFWRILLFYILAIFIIGMLIPYNSSALMGGGDDIATSPFTLVFKNAGLAFAASFMNAVILTSVLSAGNSGMYASTRMLYSMGKDGLASKAFSRTNKNGTPILSMLSTALIVVLIFVLQHVSGDAYEYIVAASGLTGFIAWVGIAVSHYRFRKAFAAQNYDVQKLKYQAKWFPFGPILAAVLCIIVIIGQDVDFIQTGDFDINRFLITYMGIPVFLAFFIYHKVRYKTKLIPLKDVNLDPNVETVEKNFQKNID
ncbi:exonuclease subunit SbcD [Staphylococcus pseudintermedius]|nr:exonuclease subunit SbcD [Staphylococcus pseudintermedius]